MGGWCVSYPAARPARAPWALPSHLMAPPRTAAQFFLKSWNIMNLSAGSTALTRTSGTSAPSRECEQGMLSTPEKRQLTACCLSCSEHEFDPDSYKIPFVVLSLKAFAPQVHSLLQTHEGAVPLLRWAMLAVGSSVVVSFLQSAYWLNQGLEIGLCPGVEALRSRSMHSVFQQETGLMLNFTNISMRAISSLQERGASKWKAAQVPVERIIPSVVRFQSYREQRPPPDLVALAARCFV